MANVLTILKKVGAILTNGHFVYTSGKHGSVYINKDALYPHTSQASTVGRLIATKYRNKKVDTVVGPALGGIILSQWAAHHLSRLNKKEVAGVYTEKTPEKDQIFTRGYNSFIKGKRVLVVEDLTTTGGSVAKVVRAVKKASGNVIGVCVMVNRNPKAVTSRVVGAPLSALGTMIVDAYEAKTCPLCKKGIPVNISIGHGKKFLATQQNAKP